MGPDQHRHTQTHTHPAPPKCHPNSHTHPTHLLCRQKFVAALKERFPDLDLTYSIGGQISFDAFPKVGGGWDAVRLR